MTVVRELDTGCRTARATGCGSCGELVQGVLPDGTAFQVTLPIDMYAVAHAEVRVSRRHAVTVVPPDRTKAAAASALAARVLSPRPVHVAVHLESAIHIGAGLGSSTADVVASVRATATALGAELSPGAVGRMAGAIEPSDGTMHAGIALTTRRGDLLEAWPWWPSLHIIALVPRTGSVATASVDLRRQRQNAKTYARIVHGLRDAASRRDPLPFLEAAATSATLNQPILPNPLFAGAERLVARSGAVGWNVAHTGTALGLLFDSAPSAAAAARLLRAEPRLSGVEVLVASAPAPDTVGGQPG